MPQQKTVTLLATSVCLLSLLNGCAMSTKDQRDPLENWNREVQTFNDKLDTYALKPIAEGYQYVMPAFADTAVTNFFNNINDIGVTINDFLQFKFEQSGMDGARFLVNSVAGIGGFIDVAEKIDLPKHDEDFDQTLGVWGVPVGPYVVLPLFGPSSPRGIGGKIGDAAMNPIAYVDNGIITGVLAAAKVTDKRADNLSTEKIATEASIDRYEFFKNSYFQQRQFLVNDGKVADDDNIDIDDMDPDKIAPINP